jgi:hypothetical protein
MERNKRGQDLPRVDMARLGSIGEAIDKDRVKADKAGWTASIERNTYLGLSAAKIAKELGPEIEPAFVRRVQASLGAVGREHGAEPHAAWKLQVADRLEPREDRPRSAAPDLPRVETRHIERLLGARSALAVAETRNLADRYGVTAAIERRTYEGVHAREIAREIARSGDIHAKDRAGMDEAFVRRVQLSLGAAPVEVGREGHDRWRGQVARQLESDERRQPSAGELTRQANAAFGELMARDPETFQQAERIIDGFAAQLPGRGRGQNRLRDYVNDKLDEIGAGKPRQPMSGTIREVSESGLKLTRDDGSVVDVGRPKDGQTPKVGERVLVTYDGQDRPSLRALLAREPARERGYTPD